MKLNNYSLSLLIAVTSLSYADPANPTKYNSGKNEARECLSEYLQRTDVSEEERQATIEAYEERTIQNHKEQELKDVLSSIASLSLAVGDTCQKTAANDSVIERLSAHHPTPEDVEFLRRTFFTSLFMNKSSKQ
ncbi:MAG: hypothetical protein WCD44_00780 [Candidatus Babeliales bacterium]